MRDEKQIVKSFCKKCEWARIVYDRFVTLYEQGEQRLELLEKVAVHFFYDLQGILQEYLFLKICNLTDPARTLGKTNLTTHYLVKELSWPPDVKARLETISSQLDSFRKQIRPARHKIIAHSDLDTHLNVEKLGAFPAGEEKAFWRSLQEFVDIIHKHHFGSVCPLEVFSEHDAEEVVVALKKSVDYDDYFEDKQREKFERWDQMRFKDA